MGEATSSLMLRGSPEARTMELGSTIAATRVRLGALFQELDRRRKRAMDVRLQLRTHAKTVIVAGVGLAALAGLAVALGVARARRKSRPIERVRRFGHAVSRMIDDPDRVAAAPPDLMPKLLLAVATTAATTAVATAVKRMVGSTVLPPLRTGAVELGSLLPPAPREVDPLGS